MSNSKWAAYDVARSRLLMQIGEVNHLIDQEQDAAKIVALENVLDALVDQSDMLSADDIELTSRIASRGWSMPLLVAR